MGENETVDANQVITILQKSLSDAQLQNAILTVRLQNVRNELSTLQSVAAQNIPTEPIEGEVVN